MFCGDCRKLVSTLPGILKKNVPKESHNEILAGPAGDVTQIDVKHLEVPDLAIFGSDCKSFSKQGKMKGAADPRASVWWQLVQWVCYWGLRGLKGYSMEMVAMCLEPQNGYEAMVDVITRHLREKLPDWQHFHWILELPEFGLPQTRRRVWLTGCVPEMARYDQHGNFGKGSEPPPMPNGVELGFPEDPVPLSSMLAKKQPIQWPNSPIQKRVAAATDAFLLFVFSGIVKQSVNICSFMVRLHRGATQWIERGDVDFPRFVLVAFVFK